MFKGEPRVDTDLMIPIEDYLTVYDSEGVPNMVQDCMIKTNSINSWEIVIYLFNGKIIEESAREILPHSVFSESDEKFKTNDRNEIMSWIELWAQDNYQYMEKCGGIGSENKLRLNRRIR